MRNQAGTSWLFIIGNGESIKSSSCVSAVRWSWDPAAVQPSIFSTESQDRAEPEKIDAEAANVSTLHTRAVRLLKFCSISANIAILAERAFTVRSTLACSGGDNTPSFTEVPSRGSQNLRIHARVVTICLGTLWTVHRSRSDLSRRGHGQKHVEKQKFEDNGGDPSKEASITYSQSRSVAMKTDAKAVKKRTLVNGKNTVHVRARNGSWAIMARDELCGYRQTPSPYDGNSRNWRKYSILSK